MRERIRADNTGDPRVSVTLTRVSETWIHVGAFSNHVGASCSAVGEDDPKRTDCHDSHAYKAVADNSKIRNMFLSILPELFLFKMFIAKASKSITNLKYNNLL